MSIFAQIQSGVVINTQVMSSTDFQNPAYIWVDITNVVPQPSVGWDFNNGVWTNPNPVPAPVPLTQTQLISNAAAFGQAAGI